ncbi:MAG: outer membrane beta-barrel protein [Gallionellaceae bacterium]|jgi:opacity protein-like surface antigen
MNKIIASVLLLAAAVAVPASAADFVSSAPTTPFYAGVQVGDANTIFGGYQIDKMFSAEINYSKYNEYVTSMGVHGVALFPLNLKGDVPLSVFAKIGVVRTTVTVRVPTFCGFTICYTEYSDSTTDLGWGGGAQYDINKRFSARAGLNFGKYKNSEVYIAGIIKF